MALEAVILLVVDYVVSLGPAIGATAGFGATLLVLWYGLPLYGRLKGS